MIAQHLANLLNQVEYISIVCDNARSPMESQTALAQKSQRIKQAATPCVQRQKVVDRWGSADAATRQKNSICPPLSPTTTVVWNDEPPLLGCGSPPPVAEESPRKPIRRASLDYADDLDNVLVRASIDEPACKNYSSSLLKKTTLQTRRGVVYLGAAAVDGSTGVKAAPRTPVLFEEDSSNIDFSAPLRKPRRRVSLRSDEHYDTKSLDGSCEMPNLSGSNSQDSRPLRLQPRSKKNEGAASAVSPSFPYFI